MRLVSGGALADLTTFTPGGFASADAGLPLTAYAAGGNADPAGIWETQPSVRTVVDFIATQIASTGFSLHRRVTETDRPVVTDHPLARVLTMPSPARPGDVTALTADGKPLAAVSAFRFWHAVICDWLLWDRWAALMVPSLDDARLVDLVQLPSQRVRFYDDTLRRVWGVWVAGRNAAMLDPTRVLHDHGFSSYTANGTSPLQTLAAVIAEQAEATRYRAQMWKRSARVPVVLERPAGAPDWRAPRKDGASAFETFRASWSNFAQGGGNEGGTPILEDGMTINKVDAFSPRDMQEQQSRQLTMIEVANAYHIAPEILGVRPGNYSVLDALRQSLYRIQLGPYFAALQDVLNTQLVPQYDDPDLYVAANIDFMLQGSFEEQAAILSTAVGAPYLTRNEARGKIDLGGIDGGDELITPLNVTEGGLASPRDTAPDDNGKRARRTTKAVRGVKAKPRTLPAARRAFANDLADHYQSLATDLQGKYGDAEDDSDLDAFDPADYADPLAGVIGDHTKPIATIAGQQAVAQMGIDDDEDAFDPDVMDAWLDKAAGGHALGILTGVKTAMLAAGVAGLASYLDGLPDRAGDDATTIATESAGFGSHDAAHANAATHKTWIAGENARASHDAADGETVAIGDVFSNGLRYPGDPNGDPSEVANCNCGISYERKDD